MNKKNEPINVFGLLYLLSPIIGCLALFFFQFTPEKILIIPTKIPIVKPTATPDQVQIITATLNYMASRCPEGCIEHINGCDIKANISFTTGERIYHLPGDEFYNQTVVEPEKGERWFCNVNSAKKLGWRHAKQPEPTACGSNCDPADSACNLKGISSEYLYYKPNDILYNEKVVNTAKGDMLLCSPEDAYWNGFSPAEP